MEEGKYGEFDMTGVHIDIHKNETTYDVAASSLHELIHQEIASKTSLQRVKLFKRRRVP